MSFLNESISEDIKLIIENGGLVTEAGRVIPTEVKPTCSALALEAWRSVAGKYLCYRRSDGKIWAEWGSSEDKPFIDGPEQRKLYVKALAELPLLVLRHFRLNSISTGIGKPKEELICKKQRLTYKIRSQWLDYFLLDNETVLLDLKSANKQLLKPKSTLSRRAFEYIQELWVEAKTNQNPTCQWVLNFDSSAQLWFAVEAHWCAVNMYQSMEPGNKTAASSKNQIYKEIRECAVYMREQANEIELIVNGDKEVEEVDPDTAIKLTAYEISKLRNNIKMRESHDRYLKAWSGDASHAQRKKGLKRIYTDGKERVITG